MTGPRDGDRTRAPGLPAGGTLPDPSVPPAPGAVRRESARAERTWAVSAASAHVRDRLLDWAGELLALAVIGASSYVAGLVIGLAWVHRGGG